MIARARHALPSLRWVATVAAALAACVAPGAEELSPLFDIDSRWPDASALLVHAEESPVIQTAQGFTLRSVEHARPGSPWAVPGRGVAADVAPDGRTTDFHVRGRSIRVRRVGADATRSSVERGVLAFDGTRVDAVFAARPAGVEELLIVDDAATTVAYDFDLPAGWTLRSALPGVVEIRDGTSAPRLRMDARRGWDAAGKPFSISAVIQDRRVRLELPDVSMPALIDPEWREIASPVTARSRASVTLLPDGKVLYAGGRESFEGNPIPTAETFDPVTATFEATAPMNDSRVDHVAVPLRSGSVLVTGGFDASDQAVATAEIFEPATRTFRPIGAPMTTGRARHTATLLSDGRVLLVGGAASPGTILTGENCANLGGVVASAEVFDPATETFTAVAALTTARADHSATLLTDGRVLVAGGQSPAGETNSVELFDPANDAFDAVGSLQEARRGHAAVRLQDGRVLVAAGLVRLESEGASLYLEKGSAEVYDPVAETFSVVPDAMDVPRAYAAAAVLPDGTVLITGGEDGNCLALDATSELFEPDGVGSGAFQHPGPPAPLFETKEPILTLLPTGRLLLLGRTDAPLLYDHDEPTPGLEGSMAVARNAHTATLLANGDVLIVGGDDPDGMNPDELHGSSEIFHADTQTVGPGPDLNFPRSSPTATRLLDGRVLIAGGGGTTGLLHGMEVYDPATNEFQKVGPLAQGRALHTATLLPDGKVLVAGGFGTGVDGAINTAEVFDPETNEFTSTAGVMGAPRLLHTATLLPTGQVLIAGGQTAFGSGGVGNALASAELYDPASRTFLPASKMGVARWRHTATALLDGRVLIAGGGTTKKSEIYDPYDGAFSYGPSTQIRFSHSATLLPSGHVMLVGGSPGKFDEDPRASLELVDPAASKASVGGVDLAAGSHVHTATLLETGQVLVAGGYVTGEGVPQAETFATARWQLIDPPARSTAYAVPKLDVATPTNGVIGAPLELAGTDLIGPEGSGGPALSPSGFPIAMWMPLEGTPILGVLAPWSASSATWTPAATGFPPGPGLLFLVTNGVHGTARSMVLAGAPNGVACTHAAACASGFCEDGVCCNEACSGSACRACSVARGGSEDGACTDVAAGENPKDLCTVVSECSEFTGTCDGAGECTKCPPAYCLDEITLAIVGEEPRDCSPYRCSDSDNGCLQKCASRLDCADGFSCTAEGVCAPPLVDEPSAIGCALSMPPEPERRGPVLAAALASALLLIRRRRAGRSDGGAARP